MRFFFRSLASLLWITVCNDCVISRTDPDSALKMANYHDSLAQSYFRNDYDSAIYHAVQSRNLYQHTDSLRQVARMTDFIARSYFNLQKYDSAIVYNDLSFDLYDSLHDTRQIAIARSRRATCHLSREDFESALRDYLESRSLFESIGDSEGLAIVSNEMGVLYYKTEDYSRAKENYFKSLHIATVSNLEEAQLFAYNNLGSLYFRLDQIDSSLFYYEKVIEGYSRKKAHRPMAIVYLNIASNLLETDNWQRALPYLEKSEESFARVQNQNGYDGLCNIWSVYYQKLGDFRTSLRYLDKSILYAKKFSKPQRELEAYFQKSEIFKELGNYKSAFESRIIYDSLASALDLETTKRDLEELRLKYNKEQYRRQLGALTIEKQQNELALAKAKGQRQILVSVFVLSLLVLGVIYSRFRANRKYQKSLQDKNLQIAESLENNRMLFNELNHRVKNNLQIIVSLLELQNVKAKDPAVSLALGDSVKRIRGIQTIHEELNQDPGKVKDQSVKKFLEDLINRLRDSYSDDGIRCQVSLDDISLSRENSIYVGMIMNEVISNAFKYAFSEGKGQLEISLQKLEDQCVLSIQDDGQGFEWDKDTGKDSLGLTLIEVLSKKLRGQYKILNREGTLFQLFFPYTKSQSSL